MARLWTAGGCLATIFLCGATVFAQAQAAKTMRVSPLLMEKQRLSGSLPSYPADAKAAGVQGFVVLQVTIGPTGTVDGLQTVSGEESLGDAVKEVVRTWTYKPYLQNAEPIAVETTITVDFKLNNSVPVGSAASGEVLILSPLRVSAGVMTAMLLSKVSPEYPPEAQAAGVSGSVMLHAFISKTGEIEDVSVVAGPDVLRGAALRAVRQWTYRPYLLKGEPVEVETQMTVDFSNVHHH